MFGTGRKTLRRNALPAIVAVLVAGLDVACAPASSRAEGLDRRPNVLIFLVDDMRAPGTMKVLRFVRRWFGRQGRTFTEALDTTPLCCPSRASLFTGMYAHNHGVVDNTHAGLQRFDQHSSIARYLQEAGYRTGAPVRGRPRRAVPHDTRHDRTRPFGQAPVRPGRPRDAGGRPEGARGS